MNLLELAKQGDEKAIAELMNRHLQSKGITTKTHIYNGCLQIILESEQAPNQQELVAFVRKGMLGLGVPSIHKVRVCGRQTDLDFTIWVEEFSLIATESVTFPSFVPASTSHNELSDQLNILDFFKKANPLERKIIVVFGTLILFSLFSSCVQQLNTTSCEGVQNAQSDYDDNYERQLSKRNVDIETINSTYQKHQALNEASSLCSN